MEIKEFQIKSIRTLNRAIPKDLNVVNMCLGAFGEFSEVSEHIKKHVFHGHELDKKKVAEEIGDTMFYITNLASELGLYMTDILDQNVDKLNTRYPKGFTTEASIKRVDTNGRA